jgi:acyl-coenzyme A synthetase/AMP-(fatty) acid ligase
MATTRHNEFFISLLHLAALAAMKATICIRARLRQQIARERLPRTRQGKIQRLQQDGAK